MFPQYVRVHKLLKDAFKFGRANMLAARLFSNTRTLKKKKKQTPLRVKQANFALKCRSISIIADNFYAFG